MVKSTEKLTDLLRRYESYVKSTLKPTQIEIKGITEGWLQPQHWQKYKSSERIPIPSPVKSTFTRIKRPEQVIDKIFRKIENFPDRLSSESFRRMYDALGVRVLVYFLRHLPLIDGELRSSDIFEISEDEPPTAYMSAHQAKVLGLDHLQQIEKESGYRSVHYVLRLKQSSVPLAERPWFELQVLTLAQDLWGVIEHHLGYKPGPVSDFAVKQQLKILSDHLAAIDDHFNFLYDELHRFQEQITYQTDDQLDPGNLPPVLAEIGISCAQRDINNVLKFLYSRGVEKVSQLRSRATPDRLRIIRHTYLAVTQRTPTPLEIVACLAVLRDNLDDESEVTELIKSQIAYRLAWDSIRQEFSQGQEG